MTSLAQKNLTETDRAKARRLELILRQIDSLPTLPVIATRLLTLTASDESHAREVIELVSSDQALTAKVLRLCRQSDRGVKSERLTVDRAVMLLGFDAIRNAVLSIKVFEIFEKMSSSHGEETVSDEGQSIQFDRVNFWRHSLAVAVMCELLAREVRQEERIIPSEAFVCGLLHDLGKLALHYVLPKSYERVVELADLNQANIAEFERRIIGMDHHTAGKRLAEQWQLPHRIQDCLWLHGAPYNKLPRLEHEKLVGLVSLADLLVRRQHLGYSGNYNIRQDPDVLAKQLGIGDKAIDICLKQLHERVEEKAILLNLDATPSLELFQTSIQQANEALGKLNGALERRKRASSTQGQILEAIAAFHASSVPGRSVQDVLDAVAENAATVFGEGYFAMLYQTDHTEDQVSNPWLFCQYSEQGNLVRSQFIDPPGEMPTLANLDPSQPLSFNLAGMIPWVADYTLESVDPRKLRLQPLSCGWGIAAVLIHDKSNVPPWQQFSALTTTWGSAIAAAAQHEGARRLGEALAEANFELAETQDRLLQTESMARLGEMAAGAAHEMNNPLAVISGRSQLLAQTLTPGSDEQSAAQKIVDQSHKLSDLITALRIFADPPKAVRRPTDINQLLDDTIKLVKQKVKGNQLQVPISLQFKCMIPSVSVDPKQIGQALAALLLNAVQASPKSSVHVVGRVDNDSNDLIIQVIDDGIGMDSYTLSHAMDPFFSCKNAGRQVGMGLPLAQQLVAAHGGELELRSQPEAGTVATLRIPLDMDG